MKKIAKYKKIISGFFILLAICMPLQSYAGLFDSDVSVDLPIGELQGLIQQLEEVGLNVTGEAGVQIRQSILELKEQATLLLDELEETAANILKEVEGTIQRLLNDVIKEAKALLKQVNEMVTGVIKCIDEALAKRIGQLKGSILDLLDKVKETVRDAIDRFYFRTSMVVDQGSSKVGVIVNSTLMLITKGVLLVIGILMLFWLVKAYFTGKTPKNKKQKYILTGIFLLLIGGIVFLLLHPRILPKLIGEEVELPDYENACTEGQEQYDQFFEIYNIDTEDARLQQIGEEALDRLNWCILSTPSPELGRGKQQQIAEIESLLFAPPIPLADDSPVLADCNPPSSGGNGPRISIHPDWYVAQTFNKIELIKAMKVQNRVPQTVLPPTINNKNDYKVIIQQSTMTTLPPNVVVKPQMHLDIQPKLDHSVLKKIELQGVRR